MHLRLNFGRENLIKKNYVAARTRGISRATKCTPLHFYAAAVVTARLADNTRKCRHSVRRGEKKKKRFSISQRDRFHVRPTTGRHRRCCS